MPSQIEYIPRNIQGMKILSEQGYSFIVISNQAGIGRKMMSPEMVDSVNSKIKSDMLESGINILEFFYCPHHWDECCNCRKPKPGLFHEASEKYRLNLKYATYIGDQISDVQAAIAAGCDPVLLDKNKHTIEVDFSQFANLSDAADYIVKKYSNLNCP